jgi:hypothetical protein
LSPSGTNLVPEKRLQRLNVHARISPAPVPLGTVAEEQPAHLCLNSLNQSPVSNKVCDLLLTNARVHV